MFAHLLGWFIVGLIVGAVARVFVPVGHRIGMVATSAIGVLGSFVGGFLGYVLFNHNRHEGALQPAGLFGSVVGAMVILWLFRKIGRAGARRY